jgi:2',3'-cyclic-nucleotide 2'-phosphodiesterase/3'-nucleotidase
VSRPIRLEPLALAVLAVLAVLACALAAESAGGARPPAASAALTILHTSDLHGHVHPRDSLADRDFGDGLARVASAVGSIRSEGRPVLLLDSGDTIQGTPEQALAFETSAEASDPIIAVMNRIGYDAMAVGNHEFDFGRDRLGRSRAEARFPFLSANITDEKTSEPAFAPYKVAVVGGVRVGILGLTTPRVPSWESPERISHLRFTDSVEAAARYVPILRGREHCDVVVVLVHEGFERDLESGEDRGTGGENQASAIAERVPGIDLLLTGHTHSIIDPRRLGAVWISQPGRFGNTLTRFDLTLSRGAKGWSVSDVKGTNLPMKGIVPDPEIVRLAGPSHDRAMDRLSETVARLATPLEAREARVRDTAILDWLHEVQLREGKAQLSIASLLPGTLPAWEPGPLTLRQIWSFYPYENTLVTVRASGAQVREALERAARCFSGIEETPSGPAWRRNAAVWGYNCDTLDGAEYALDPTRPEGRRLLYLRREGRPIGDAETFLVALNSYRAAGGGGYEVWRDCARVEETRASVRDLLVKDARSRGTLSPKTDWNWLLAPGLPEGPFRIPSN